jgi:preprotein translocase subunit SecD
MLHFSPIKIALVLLSCILSVLFALPNFFAKETVAKWPSFVPRNQMAMGLDLKGGAHLLLSMDVESLRRSWLSTLQQDARRQLRDAKIFGNVGISGNSVVVRLNNAADLKNAQTEMAKLNTQIGNALLGTSGNSLDIKGEGTQITLTPTEPGFNERLTNAIGASLETVRRRIDSLGTTEPSIVRQGRDRILVQVPGFEDTATLKRILGDTAVLNFHKVHETISAQQAMQTNRIPIGYRIYEGAPGNEREGGPYLLQIDPIVKGEHLVDAQQGFDGRTNEPVINFRFNQRAATDFGRFTTNNIGRPFAIVLDDKVLSAPVIRSEILGGSGQISGSFTVQSASELALKIRSGSLPAKLTIVEERTVGPSLGKDSVDSGSRAFMIGSIVTILLTIIAYGTFGIFAATALIVNGLMIVALMSAIGSTLTLPGIAGLVLTIGMAVDANVLIYERIREELRAGKSAIAAIDTGFNRAIIAIMDSQLTTLAAAIIMFWLGSGPIRGFAVTLSIGIFTSVFTAVTVTRMLVALWLKGARAKAAKIDVPV